MDSVSNSSSDSDISDDWNIVSAKEANSVLSETESIEVLEDDEEHVADCNTRTDDKIVRNDDATGKILELAASGVEEIAVQENDDVAVPYCVFPEEFHDVFSQGDSSINTSELVCSISLVILCTVASSFMVISADGIMPSFIDVLVWQGLPDSQKDFNINNPGLIIQQLKVRNDLLENKFSHLGLAVKAFEENMISETALAEFVVDWQKSVKVNSHTHNFKELKENDGVFMTSSLPETQQFRETLNENVVTEQVQNDSVYQEDKFKSGQPTDIKEDIGPDVDSKFANGRNRKSISLLNNVLSLFNASSEIGSRLNKATLLLLNTKDKLELLESSKRPSSVNIKTVKKLDKLNDRLRNIESKINVEMQRFFTNFSKMIYGNILNFERNVNEFICKNSEIGNVNDFRLNNLCIEKNKRNVKDNSNYKIRGGMSDKKRQDEKKGQWNINNNFYKTDEDAMGKSKENHVNIDYEQENKKAYINEAKRSKDFAGKANSIVKPTEFDNSEKSNKYSGINEEKVNKHSKRIYKENAKHNYVKAKNDNKENNNKILMENNGNLEKEELDFNYGKYEKDRTKKNNENDKSHKKNNQEETRKNNYNLRSKNVDSSMSEENLNKKEAPVNENRYNKQHVSVNDKVHHYEYDKLTMKRIEKPSNFKAEEHKNKEKKDKQYSSFSKSDFKDEQIKKNNDQFKKREITKNHFDKEKKTWNSENEMTQDDIKRIKEDILNSVNGYIDQLLSTVHEGIKSNSTKFTSSKDLSGDWFLTLGKLRSELREKDRKSDWMFNRAEGRHNLRDLSTDYPNDESFYDKTYWFFRRAWERNRIRL